MLKFHIIVKSAGFVLALFAWQLLGAIMGIVLGIVIRYPYKFAYNDNITQVTLAIGMLYFAYYIADIIGVSGVLAVVLFGILLSSTKIKISPETEVYTNNFWEYISFLTKTLIFVMAGIRLGYDNHYPQVTDIGYVILLYILCLVARIMIYLLASPVLRKSGPQLSWRSIVISVWGIYRGSPSLLLAVLYSAHYQNEFGYRVLSYSTLIVILSLLLNSFLMRFLLSVLGLYDLSRTKRVNMNMAVAQINACREKAMFSLKLDRIIADANWLVVESITRIGHPYRKKMKGHGTYDDDIGNDFQIRLLSCPDCGGHTLCPPSLKEIDDMTLEAKHRILKAQLVSYWRQYDLGILSRRGIRILTNLIDGAVTKEDPMLRAVDLKIQTEGSKILKNMKSCFGHLLTVTSKQHRFIPTNIIRAMCFRLCTSRTFQIIMASLAMFDLAILLHLTMLYYFQNQFGDHDAFAFYAQILDFMFFSIFLLEFWIQVLGIGFVQYFRSHVNKVEFAVGILIRGSEITMCVDTSIDMKQVLNVLKSYDIILFLKTLLLLRAARLYIFWTALIPKLLNVIDRQMDDSLMKSYDIGKAFLVGQERVMKFLAHVVCNETVYNNLRRVLEADRLKVTKDLGLIQKDRPAIAITMKTRHAIRHIINIMSDCLNDLKEEGILDAIENKVLVSSLDLIRKKLRDISVVNPCPPDFILREIPWLHGDHDTSDFLLHHSRLSSYDTGDVIIKYGDDPVGLYVLVSGLVKSYYRPSSNIIEQTNKYGILPNCDFFTNLKFDLPQEDYVVSGNLVGETGMVTGRRYDMDVLCETAVQVYYIPWKIMKAVLHDSEDSGLMQSKVWKSIGIKIAVILLQYSTHFQGWLREKLLLYLQRSVVPMLSGVTTINITDKVDDVILVEGVIMDGITRAVFFGPFYVPRSVHKIILPDHSTWKYDTTYETRLLIIPNVHADQNDILGPEGIFKDHYRSHPPLQTMEILSDASVVDSTTKLCPHGQNSGWKLDSASSQRFFQKRAGIHKKVGFIDYMPNIKGIDSTMPTTSYALPSEKKTQIKETIHVRRNQDSTITYIKDIDEQSEGESVKDDMQPTVKSKHTPHLQLKKRRRRTEQVYDYDIVSDSSFEEDMVLKKSKMKGIRSKICDKIKSKIPNRARKIFRTKEEKTSLTDEYKRTCSSKDKVCSVEVPRKKKTAIKKADHLASDDNLDDSINSKESYVKVKTFEVEESLVTLIRIKGESKHVQTDLQAKDVKHLVDETGYPEQKIIGIDHDRHDSTSLYKQLQHKTEKDIKMGKHVSPNFIVSTHKMDHSAAKQFTTNPYPVDVEDNEETSSNDSTPDTSPLSGASIKKHNLNKNTSTDSLSKSEGSDLELKSVPSGRGKKQSKEN
ncbi:sodium/hydrogen exchanger 10-like isoform X3 [Cimex lectularius]|uniref:Cyclic nucleotide-binding domain-containing protein n=1 Tax=Cimex lectularius TaxID=79782 RepID=A0A8I6SFC0_CIMLE|nr:sodium/hydrogen exchanger 10-like isoform X3 [Cimex lectularius]